MMATFSYHDYEGSCVAIALLDATTDALEALGFEDDVKAMHELRNRVNDFRLGHLKRFPSRTFHVSDISVAMIEARK